MLFGSLFTHLTSQLPTTLRTIATSALVGGIALSCVNYLALGSAQAEENYWETDFIVTAYYSPIPGQDRYILGTLEADRVLNGNGIAGADGTPVYFGMLAAPKEFTFGTSIYLEGIGYGEVHDRGGAIKDNRIDVWMGFGDEGLDRSMAWGKRKVHARVYHDGTVVPSNFSLDDSLLYEYSSTTPIDGYFRRFLTLNDVGQDVADLVKYLSFMGYYRGEPTTTFDIKVRDALIIFQLANDIIEHRDAYGAGNFGPISARVMNAIVEEITFDKNIANRLYPGSRDAEEVKVLQERLAFLGFFDAEVSGIYGNQTVDAVYRFQLSQGIVASEHSSGAGAVGPSTLAALNDAAVMKDIIRLDTKEPYRFNKLMSLGDKGRAVIELKQRLQAMGYLTSGPVDSLFDESTRDAILRFQIDKYSLDEAELGLNLDSSDNAVVSGALDQNTLDLLNEDLVDRIELDDKHLYTIPDILFFGRRDPYVVRLKKKLDILGYADFAEYSDLFDTATQEGVFEFQVDHGIVSTLNESGAGHFGPRTLSEFNKLFVGI